MPTTNLFKNATRKNRSLPHTHSLPTGELLGSIFPSSSLL